MSLDLRFDEDLMLISSFKAIVSNSGPLTVYSLLQKVSGRILVKQLLNVVFRITEIICSAFDYDCDLPQYNIIITITIL